MDVVALEAMWSMWNSSLLIHVHEDGNEYMACMMITTWKWLSMPFKAHKMRPTHRVSVTPEIFHTQGNRIIGSQGKNYNFKARVEVQFLKKKFGNKCNLLKDLEIDEIKG